MRLTDIFASSDQTNSLGNQFRAKRIAFFKNKISALPKPLRILDVGGLESFWENSGFANDPDFEFTILNLEAKETRSSNMIGISGDATNLSQFSDAAYDVVFSNSVIEHVYTWEKQVKMAAELIRVGKYYYVQTPNKHFFLEPHYILPFFQYLPSALKMSVLTKTPLSRGRKWPPGEAAQYVEEIRLISFSEMKKLFPHAEFYFEKFLGMDKSFTAHNFPVNS